MAPGYGVAAGSELATLRAAPRLWLESDTTVLVFGAEPLGTRVMQGNVIASSTALLERGAPRAALTRLLSGARWR